MPLINLEDLGKGDIFDLQNDVTMSVITKFFYRYENDLNGLKQLIKQINYLLNKQ